MYRSQMHEHSPFCEMEGCSEKPQWVVRNRYERRFSCDSHVSHLLEPGENTVTSVVLEPRHMPCQIWLLAGVY